MIDEAVAWARLLAIRAARSVGPTDETAHGLAAIDIPPAEMTAAARMLLAALTPVAMATPDRPLTIAQMGQSLDGRVATATGASHYINGVEARAHLHRLRALCDAVIVGAGTVEADNPRLTTRLAPGPNPLRVVLDPRRRLSADRSVFRDGAAQTLVITGTPRGVPLPSGVDVIVIPEREGHLPPHAVLAALHDRGCGAILVEGGAWTVSAFLTAQQLDRLHLLIAPLIIGSGRSGLMLPPIDALQDALRPPAHWYPLGPEMLVDLDIAAIRHR